MEILHSPEPPNAAVDELCPADASNIRCAKCSGLFLRNDPRVRVGNRPAAKFFHPDCYKGQSPVDVPEEELDSNPEMEYQAAVWIQEVSGETLQGESIVDALQDGVALCKLMNRIRPGTVTRISEDSSIQQMGNVIAALNGMRQLGVAEGDLFSVTDLYCRSNEKQVICSIFALATAIASDFQGPQLVVPNPEGKIGGSTVSEEEAVVVNEPPTKDEMLYLIRVWLKFTPADHREYIPADLLGELLSALGLATMSESAIGVLAQRLAEPSSGGSWVHLPEFARWLFTGDFPPG